MLGPKCHPVPLPRLPPCGSQIEEGEMITLDIIPLKDLWRRTTDAKTLSAILLHEKLASMGLLEP